MSLIFREEGLWWVPQNPEQISVAALEVASERCTLKSAIGPLSNIGISNGQFPPGPSLLVGRSHSGSLFTCARTFYSKFHQNMTPTGGHGVTDLDVLSIYKGQHFQTLEEVVFRRAGWLYTNLHTWLFDVPPPASLVDVPPLHVEEMVGQQRTYQVTHQRGDLWDVDIGDGFRLRNDFRFNSSLSYSPNPTVTFSHLDGIFIESQQPRPIESFRPFEHRFRALVNLLGDCQLEIFSLKCRQAIDQPPEVEVFGDGSRVPFGTRRDARRGGMPLPFSSLQNFNEVVARWNTLYERLEPVVNLYLFGKHNSHLDIGNMFLGVMQALEAYHRSFHNGAFMTAEQYDADVRPVLNAAIPAVVEGAFRQRLQSAIQYGYEFSLRRRLRDLVDALPPSQIFETARNTDFRNRTVDTRNTMVHQIPAPEFPPMEGGDLYNAINVWREVLFALILGQLGVAANTIEGSIQRLRAAQGTFIAV